jgi:hypothetical protein
MAAASALDGAMCGMTSASTGRSPLVRGHRNHGIEENLLERE